jgi:hypothetical protein
MVDLAPGPANCQEWTGSRLPAGYGKFSVGGSTGYAARFILGFLRGRPLGPDEKALHHCDNPPCLNPLHLYVGTDADNARDREARGRRREGWLRYQRRAAGL